MSEERRLNMKLERREFLVLGAAASVAPLLSFGLSPTATAWPKEVFTSTELRKTLEDLLQGQNPVEVEGKISLTVPGIAENGGQVRVTVEADLPEVETISLLVEKNPIPLTSQFIMNQYSKPEVAINLKVRETSRVIALVKAGGKFYIASSEVRVTAGGCG